MALIKIGSAPASRYMLREPPPFFPYVRYVRLTRRTIQRRLAWPLRKDDTHKSRKYRLFRAEGAGKEPGGEGREEIGEGGILQFEVAFRPLRGGYGVYARGRPRGGGTTGG